MVELEKAVDSIAGTAITALLAPFAQLDRFFPAKAELKRILIIKLWAVGDAVVALPMIRALRQRYPDARIDVLCRNRNAAVFRACTDINELILLEPPLLAVFTLLPKLLRRYDAVIDTEPYMKLSAIIGFAAARRRIGFAGQWRSLLYTAGQPFRRDRHMARQYLDMAALAGAKGKDELIPLATSKEDAAAAADFLRKNGVRPGSFLVGMAPAVGESGKTRLWFNDRWAELADRFIERKKATVIFVGAPADKPLVASIQAAMRNPAIDATGVLKLPQTFALMKHFSAFIGCDSGPMHIAAAQGVPTVGLFGPNVPSLWAPLNKRSLPIYHPLSCSPCIRNELGKMPDCIRKTDRYLCMRLIGVDEAWEATLACAK